MAKIPQSQEAGRTVALLRGVNVGGRNKVAMAELRGVVEGLGYSEVETHLQSGNVVCAVAGDAPQRVAAKLEAAIEDAFGFAIPVLARTAAELRAAVAANPLVDMAENPSRLLVTFLSGPVDREKLEGVDADAFAPDRFAAGEREIYVWAPDGVSETKLTWAFWERRLGVIATARNWNTVTRLLELAGG